MSKYQCVRSVIVEQNRRGDRLHLANVTMPVKSLAIEKAHRPITVREDDRTEKIPVIQAILHKFAVAAANGNIHAQQNYLNLLIGGAEAARRTKINQ
jgi:Family of unknown function (DUF5681)